MNEDILECIQNHFLRFIDQSERAARESALEDLKARTQFVTTGHSDFDLAAEVKEEVRFDSSFCVWFWAHM